MVSTTNSNVGCCGHKGLSGFSGGEDVVRQQIGNCLEDIAGVGNTYCRFVQIILSSTQEAVYGKIVRSFGFSLICAFRNSTGSTCYVYGRVTGEGGLVKKTGSGKPQPLMKEVLPITAKKKQRVIPNPFLPKSNSEWVS